MVGPVVVEVLLNCGLKLVGQGLSVRVPLQEQHPHVQLVLLIIVSHLLLVDYNGVVEVIDDNGEDGNANNHEYHRKNLLNVTHWIHVTVPHCGQHRKGKVQTLDQLVEIINFFNWLADIRYCITLLFWLDEVIVPCIVFIFRVPLPGDHVPQTTNEVSEDEEHDEQP